MLIFAVDPAVLVILGNRNFNGLVMPRSVVPLQRESLSLSGKGRAVWVRPVGQLGIRYTDWADVWRTCSEGEHEHYNPTHGVDVAGEETDGSEGAVGHDDAAEAEEALTGEDEDDEEGNEVRAFDEEGNEVRAFDEEGNEVRAFASHRDGPKHAVEWVGFGLWKAVVKGMLNHLHG
jgi:hypothetical protein